MLFKIQVFHFLSSFFFFDSFENGSTSTFRKPSIGNCPCWSQLTMDVGRDVNGVRRSGIDGSCARRMHIRRVKIGISWEENTKIEGAERMDGRGNMWFIFNREDSSSNFQGGNGKLTDLYWTAIFYVTFGCLRAPKRFKRSYVFRPIYISNASVYFQI